MPSDSLNLKAASVLEVKPYLFSIILFIPLLYLFHIFH